jgi:hypothetical protein
MFTAGSPLVLVTRRDVDHADRLVDVDRSASCPVSVLRVLGRDGTSAADPLSSWQPDRSVRDVADGGARVRRRGNAVRMVVR